MSSDDDLSRAGSSSDRDGVPDDPQDSTSNDSTPFGADETANDPADDTLTSEDTAADQADGDADSDTADGDQAQAHESDADRDDADDAADADEDEDEGTDSLWSGEDDEESYSYVRRSDPGWDMSKWLIAAGVATVTILLSFILIPKVFSASEPEAPTTSAVATTAPPTTEAPPVVSYRDVIMGASPVHFWEFSYGADPGQDAMGTSNLTLGKDIGLLGSSAVKGGSGAIDCSGTYRSRVNSQTPETPVGDLTVEVWVNTATASGGQIINFGTAAEGASNQTDRTLFIDHGGFVHFGVRDAKRFVVSSDVVVNDGKWHHVVGTLSAGEGIKLYVDGQLMKQEEDAKAAQEFEGHWRICGDSLSGWPSATGSATLIGTIDEVAIYNRALTAEEIAQHHQVAL